MELKEFSNILKTSGIVGAGGAGFPTYFKYSSECEYIILNGAECEPLLQVDQQILKIHAKEIIEAVTVALEVTNAKKAYIALKKKYKDTIKVLEPLCKGKIELFKLDNFYPAGDEQILVNEITGRVVPEGGIPIQVGIIVNNAVTFYNIYQALKGIPVTEREVTIAGEVVTPITLRVPIGTSVLECIKLAGGTTVDKYCIVDGGPMMGRIIGEDSKITKTTSGILIFPKDHIVIQQKNEDISKELWMSKSLCCQCMLCTEVCPRYLIGHRMEPHKIMRMISYGNIEDHAEKMMNAFLCCECNACTAFGCPMGLSPKNVNKIVKKKLLDMNIKNSLNNKPEKERETRKFRKIPVNRLIKRLNIGDYMKKAPFINMDLNTIKEVNISLNSHIGIPAKPVIKVGDSVSKGQLIASSPENGLGSCYHSSINGVIKEVNDNYIKIGRN